ncbi:cation-transporting ATPase, putative [Talaromyces stipitatus ATCC 10500]|uniref:Cation-transporting ATPase, putative n=1 Tax=Talaromyces stipitatus (strain ATCC 10500 / CBS 375.48 / QM 6759 / NRRL 1006) TaxID=441959 RepID=B8LYB5_TALSN|nr:cation-transporting ATPase, putative [Talaromyces stipitatus ATCC 10500]EED22844.1 cation-transporting ATPase, putative [Talaromyces stipitatus ATCC 10500]
MPLGQEFHDDDSTSSTLNENPSTPLINLVDGDIESGAAALQNGPRSDMMPELLQARPDGQKFSAIINVGGMSCVACSNSITNGVRENFEFVDDISVNNLTHSAAVRWTGARSDVNKIIEQIEDMGFEAVLDHVNSKAVSARSNQNVYVVDLAITGLTCGSCVESITRGLQSLPFVTNVAINFLSHSGKVVFEGRENSHAIIAKIEDLGYNASIHGICPVNSDTDTVTPTGARTISIRIDGMFNDRCIDLVVESFNDISGLKIEERPSLNNPIITITYFPQPPSLTIRSILNTIDSVDKTFHAKVYRPPSNEERSRLMQKRTRVQLLRRLLFVFIISIPTFLIGMVFMNFAAPENEIRKYLEAPQWLQITRMDWTLLFLTTPVMFYGADLFHKRAFKEIYALWRLGSPTPLAQRFFRFGSMNLLISAGTAVAYVASLISLIFDAVYDTAADAHRSTCFDSVVFLTLFILAGRCLETYSKERTDDAVASLGQLLPSEAILVEKFGAFSSERFQNISTHLLEIGDIVTVPHGALPPADGTILSTGTYHFDESSLTGESSPVQKSAGDQVFAGAINVGSPVQVRLTGVGGLSMLDQIIMVVREGQSKRASIERAVDTLTSLFVPVITLIAIITFITWVTLASAGVLPRDYLDSPHISSTFWSLEFAIAVFVVACPCGLALAAPTALFVGGGVAARHGILVKGGGEAFQEASRLNAVVFDKTGTLTDSGSLHISDYEVLTGNLEQLSVAWNIAQSLEEQSKHPIATAIRQFCQDKGAPFVHIVDSDISEIAGHGMQGTFTLNLDGERSDDGSSAKYIQYEAAIGNERLLQRLSPPSTDTYYLSSLLSKYKTTGKSVVILSIRRSDAPEPSERTPLTPVIVFAVSESIRPEAARVVARLQDNNVDVFMCTGDNQTTAQAVAETLGIPHTHIMANVLPNEKADFVNQVQQGTLELQSISARGKRARSEARPRSIVAFVGDGVNDAPALAAADVSVAMASGSDVAIKLVLLSRRVFRRVRFNFVWALAYNVCLIPIAAGVLYPVVIGQRECVIDGRVVLVNKHFRLSPVWAALAMAFSSISVVCSSLALGIEKRHFKQLFRRSTKS